ncbi:hypothetical protein LTR05_001088 [Lithohypha guttulata]|uniref:ER-bound oxygenase mpaB/mpaB'/Rubber oxygenase catalytic domain-containing protein n=1 Tax=Lithohypha guttulata TaxID=1690604 RepID=A0AAN7T773_9EURO|nr:hypothetical protein LTR05_001088 [Lithohypha guttulata]
MKVVVPSWLNPFATYTIICFVAYSSLCQVLRFQRIKSMKRKHGFGTPPRPDLSAMTDQEAYEIQSEIAEAEFPALFEKGLQLALFRTYGIPSISRLLVQTAQLSTGENVAKRYADTAVIITEIYSNKPNHARSIEAFARLNYLHGHYLKQGRIGNDDMLYTLALFMNHPVEWINKYEWRQLTDLEVCAAATFHKSMGEAMEISYDVLPGSRNGWKDGLQFYRELDHWAKDYEEKNMLPHKDNYLTAIKTQELLLSTVPSFTHGLVVQMIAAAMDDRLRNAIMFEPSHAAAKVFLNLFMPVRRFYLRYFALPKFDWQREKGLSKEESPEGRRWIRLWSTTPHYVKPTFWNRWGPGGLYQLMLGAPRPGDVGMCPEGYLRSNLGPRAFNGKGIDVFEQQKARLTQSRTGGCPFIIKGS